MLLKLTFNGGRIIRAGEKWQQFAEGAILLKLIFDRGGINKYVQVDPMVGQKWQRRTI